MPSKVGISFLSLTYFAFVTKVYACENLSSLASNVVAEWWNIKPYIYTNEKTEGVQQLKGLLYELLRKLDSSSSKILYGSEYDMKSYKEFKMKLDSLTQEQDKIGNVSVFLPVMIKKNDRNPCAVKVFLSRGPAYVVRRNVQKPLTQLGHSFKNGGQIIGLTLILTVISGVFIWILDRHKNPEDFPPSFITGTWQGFWWAFVTMTTVGYGDTAPKSIPARLYSILWMLLGMVAFSVLTANFASSLTHEIDSDLELFSKRVAVLNGTLTDHAAVAAGAAYEAYYDIPSIITALGMADSSIKGFLLDRHIAAAYDISKESSSLEIGRTVEYEYYVGMVVRPPGNSTHFCEVIQTCVESVVKTDEFEAATLKVLSESVNVVSKSNESTTLFDDYEFLIILVALFSVLVTGGLLWEYFYYKPKMQRLNKVNEDVEMESNESLNNANKAVLLKNEVEELCEECRTKVDSIMKHEGKYRLQGLHFGIGINPLDGLSIIGNQLSAIPGVSSIKRIGSELPYTVRKKIKKQEVPAS